MELLHALFMNSVSLAEGVTTLETCANNERPEPTPNLIDRLRNLILKFEKYDFF